MIIIQDRGRSVDSVKIANGPSTINVLIVYLREIIKKYSYKVLMNNLF